MNALRVADRPNFEKDTRSGAILNTDTAGLHARRRERARTEAFDAMQSEVISLRADVDRLTSLLEAVCEKTGVDLNAISTI